MREMGINPKEEKQKIKEKIEKKNTDNKKYIEDTQLPQNPKPQPEEIEENKKVFSFTLRPSLIEKLDKIAKEKYKNSKRKRSEVLEIILEEYFEEKGI